MKNVMKVVAAGMLMFTSSVSSELLGADDESTKREEKVIVRRMVRDGEGPHSEEVRKRAFLGIQMIELTPELRDHYRVGKEVGVLVSKVTDASPAQQAGLKAGDIITAIDGKVIDSPSDIGKAIRDKKSGEQIKIEINRSGASQHVFAKLVEKETRVKMMMLDGKHPDFEHLMTTVPGEAAAKLKDFFNSPEWKDKVAKMGDCGRNQGRIDALEQRLKDLEKQLAKK